MRAFWIYSLILFLVIFVVSIWQPIWANETKIWTIFIFQTFVGFVTHRLGLSKIDDNTGFFVNFYLLGVVLRLVGSLAFIGFFLHFKDVQAGGFIASYFVLYLFYQVFELWFFVRKLRQN